MHSLRRVSLVAAICLGTFMTSLDISIVNVALPAMQTALNTTLSGLQWVVDAYALCLSACILSSGPLSERFGHKRVWLCGIALFTVGSALCALAGSLPALLAGRVVQGIAGAAIIPGALSLLTRAFPEELQRIRVIGIWSAVSALSLVAGPLLGGILVHITGWQVIFLINLPIGIITLLLGHYGLRESATAERLSLDPVGQLLSVLWLGALTYGLIASGEHGWRSPLSAGSLVAALLLFAAFLRVEKSAIRPLLPLALFRQVDFTVCNLASAVLGFSAYSSVFFVSLFLQQAQGWNALETGWRMAPEFAAMGLVAMTFGRLSARFSVLMMAVTGYVLMAVGLLLMSQLEANSTVLLVSLLLALLGAGMGLAMPATSALVMRSAPAARSGITSAIMNALRQAGMTLGIALLGTLMNLHAQTVLTTSLRAAHFSQPAALAREAIVEHRWPGGAEGEKVLGEMARAVASGFGSAMLWAGLISLAMAMLLMVLHPRLRRSASGQALVSDQARH